MSRSGAWLLLVMGILIAVLLVTRFGRGPAARLRSEPLPSEDVGTLDEAVEEGVLGGSSALVPSTRREPSGPTGFLARIELEWTASAAPPSEASPLEVLLEAEDPEHTTSVTIPGVLWEGTLLKDEYRVSAAVSSQDGFLATPSGGLSAATPSIRVTVSSTETWELIVTDSESGEPLEGLELVGTTDNGAELPTGNGLEPPADGVPLLHGSTSPVRVPESRSLAAFYWIRSDDHGWTPFLRTRRQKRVHLVLPRSGSLEVSIDASSILRDPRWSAHASGSAIELSLSGPGTRTSETIDARRPTMLFEGLRPGVYTVRASEAGLGAVGSLAEAGVLVEASEQASMSLALAWPAEPADLEITAALGSLGPELATFELSRLEGDGWSPGLRERIDSWTPIPGTDERERHFLNVSPGTYRGRITPAGRFQTVAVEAGVHARARFDLSDVRPFEITLSGSTRPARSWLRVEYDDDPGGETLPHAPRMQAWFRPVPLTLQAFGEGIGSPPLRVDPGRCTDRSIELELDRGHLCAVTLSLWSADGRGWGDVEAWRAYSIEPTDPGSRVVSTGFGLLGNLVPLASGIHGPDYSECDFILSRPGAYRVKKDGRLLRQLWVDGVERCALHE